MPAAGGGRAALKAAGASVPSTRSTGADERTAHLTNSYKVEKSRITAQHCRYAEAAHLARRTAGATYEDERALFNAEEQSLAIARAWCAAQGSGWSVTDQAGRGGTAPVYGVSSPEGAKALKIYDAVFSQGEKGAIEDLRIEQQKQLGRHGFSGMVEVHDGGRFQDRIFLLMNRAPGQELEKRLADVPRDKIRTILDQVAQAAIFLRGRDIAHRDIKSANVFVTDDFATATVLDLSVMREITDPVGIGTDQGDRLPIVATARYSPPEYLFRLLEPGAEAWHALDVYQLGGLLHDLIMREPLFEKEYQAAKDNRYRFAWTVATIAPLVEADDVDRDLLVLARRALDKDWRRRSELKLEDFLNSAVVRQRRSLAMLGVGAAAAPPMPTAEPRIRLGHLAEHVRDDITSQLRAQNVLPTHDVEWPDDETCEVRFGWTSGQADDAPVNLRIRLRRVTEGHAQTLVTVAPAWGDQERGVDLPAVPWEDEAGRMIVDGVMQVLGELADRFMSAEQEGV